MNVKRSANSVVHDPRFSVFWPTASFADAQDKPYSSPIGEEIRLSPPFRGSLQTGGPDFEIWHYRQFRKIITETTLSRQTYISQVPPTFLQSSKSNIKKRISARTSVANR